MQVFMGKFFQKVKNGQKYPKMKSENILGIFMSTKMIVYDSKKVAKNNYGVNVKL